MESELNKLHALVKLEKLKWDCESKNPRGFKYSITSEQRDE
jgi:hypothetical protein